PPLIGGPVGLCAILDHGESPFICQREYVIHLAWPTAEMHEHYSSRPGRQRALDSLRRKVAADGIDIGKYGARSLQHHTASRCDERARSDNHVVACSYAQHSQRQLESDCPIHQRYGMAAPESTGVFPFKTTALISCPVVNLSGFQHLRDRGYFVVTEARPGYEIFKCILCVHASIT